MWALVVVVVLGSPSNIDANAKYYSSYSSFAKCAMAREQVLIDLGKLDGYPPANHQVVCIRTTLKK